MGGHPNYRLHAEWRISVGSEWDVLGPFPIHAREQHFLSPAYPLDLKEPIDFAKSWPSSYADNGAVSWSKAYASPDGRIEISFPHIRWKSLRGTEGWAALQHHAVLHATLTVYPPTVPVTTPPPSRLAFHLVQASYFTVVTRAVVKDAASVAPIWYAGNIYDMENALPRPVDLPTRPLLTEPTVFDIFLSGDYEIRLFGDPLVQENSEVPVQKLRLSVGLEQSVLPIVHESARDVVCDFVDGLAFGFALSVALRSTEGWWFVKELKTLSDALELFLQTETRIAPGQLRAIPIGLKQNKPFFETELKVHIKLVSDRCENHIETVTLQITQLRHWDEVIPKAIKATCFYARSIPTPFLCIPPQSKRVSTPAPPILALREYHCSTRVYNFFSSLLPDGAGVDIFNQDFWIESLPTRLFNWVIVPAGRTSWGLDWHGPSANEVWDVLAALIRILNSNASWNAWAFLPEQPVILMGHSNGGQGAWFLASRFPDRVAGLVPAAGFIKSQAYVPLTMSRSAHFIDPELRSILESALTPDDNDLHLSNLVDIPVLAIHGGDDENVPVWHSREAVSVIKTWSPKAEIDFHEDVGSGHWYPSVFRNDLVQSFLDKVSAVTTNTDARCSCFTLTVTDPNESGSLHGWKINSTSIPGRLARLSISFVDETLARIRTANVHSFSVDVKASGGHLSTVQVDDDRANLPLERSTKINYFSKNASNTWKVHAHTEVSPGIRMQQVLTSAALITIVASDVSPSPSYVAIRIAQDLQTYHKMDVNIVSESDVLSRARADIWPSGNIVFIGEPSSELAVKILGSGRTSFRPHGDDLLLNNVVVDCRRSAVMLLHPHPDGNVQGGLMLFILARHQEAFEKAYRLFPIRTGVPVPSWVITSSRTDIVGAAGLAGAGVWGIDWRWNPPMSWYH